MPYYISIQIPCLPSNDSMTTKDGDAFLFPLDCKVCVSHIRYLFICSEAGPGELRHTADALRHHHDAMPNNAIKTNNYNLKATLTMTNINIYWTVYQASIHLLNFKHIIR